MNTKGNEMGADCVPLETELVNALEFIADEYEKVFAAYLKATGETAFGWGRFPLEQAREAIAKSRKN